MKGLDRKRRGSEFKEKNVCNTGRMRGGRKADGRKSVKRDEGKELLVGTEVQKKQGVEEGKGRGRPWKGDGMPKGMKKS